MLASIFESKRGQEEEEQEEEDEEAEEEEEEPGVNLQRPTLENSRARCCSFCASAGMPRPNFRSRLPSSASAVRMFPAFS